MTPPTIKHLIASIILVVALCSLFIFTSTPTSPPPSSPTHRTPHQESVSTSASLPLIDQTPSSLKIHSSNHSENKIQPFNQWLDSIRNKENLEPNTIRQGVALAKARRPIMLSLMKEAPEEALLHAINWADYKALPDEVKHLVETPFSQRGDYLVLPNCSGHGSPPSYEVALTESQYQFTAFGRRKNISTKENTPLQGIHLDGLAVVRSAPLQRLTPEETSAVKDDFPIANRDITRGFSSGKKITTPPIVALGGGKLFYFSSEDELNTTNKKLEKLDELPGPHSGAQVIFLEATGDDNTGAALNWQTLESTAALEASSWTETKKKIFYIRVDFSDNTGESTSQATLANVLNTSVSDTIRDMSYGKTWIDADVSSMVVRLPSPTTTYLPSNNSLLLDDAKAAFNALNTDINLSDYDIVAVHFKSIDMQSGGMTYAGLASVGGGSQWIQGTTSTRVITHELGHNYGVSHAKFWETSDGSVVGAGTTVEYGNTFDIMGSGPAPEGHFHPQAKQKLSWLEAADWTDVSEAGSGTYRLYRGDNKDTTGVRGLRINKNNLNDYYWVGYRRGITENPYLQGSIVLNWEKSGTSWLVDTTPGSPAGKDDSGVIIGRTYSDTTADVHITPIAQGGTSPNQWIDVTVNLGPFPDNTPPTASLIGPTTGDARTVLTFSASANDANDDELAYSWNFGDGAVVNNTSSVSHQWRVGGSYPVTVTVTDMKGGSVTKSLNITVNDPLTQWTIGNVGFTASMQEANYLNGRYILTGNQYAYFSIDGTSWTRSYLNINFNAGGIAYGNGIYVITGYDWINSAWAATAYYSTDGKYWSHATLPTLDRMNDVVWGNDRFVAVGDNGATMYSLDGITWTEGNIIGTASMDAISFANGEFLAVGDNEVHASSDGVSWVDRSANTGLASWHNLKDITYANGQFLAGGWYSGILYSTDQGTHWQAATMPSGVSYDIEAITVQNGAYVALADRRSDGAAVMLVSSDGRSWEENYPSTLEVSNTLTFGNGVFFSTQGSAGHTQFSDSFFPSNQSPTTTISGNSSANARELVTFTSTASDPDGDTLIRIWDFQDGTPLVTGSSTSHSFPTGGTYTVKLSVTDSKGGVATDTLVVTVNEPLNTWTQRSSGTTATLNDITLGAGKLVTVGSNGTYRVSTDAITWTGGSLSGNVYFRGITYDGSQFIAVGQDYDFSVGVIYTSPDGSTWTSRHRGGNMLKDIAYGNGIYITSGDSGTILRSTDAITWSSMVSGVTTNLQGVSFGENGFVIVGASSNSTEGTTLTSSNGLTWTNTSAGLGTSQGFFHIEFAHDRFLASGFYTRLRHSTDGGATFQTLQTGDNYRTPGMAYGNGVYLATGTNQSDSNSDINLLSTDGEKWIPLTTPSQENRNAATFFQNTFITVGEAGNIWQSDPITPPTGWQTWQAEQFPSYPANSGAYDDYDGDGIPNLLEYITGSDAKSPTSFTLPTLAEESGYMTMTVHKAPGVNGFNLAIEASDDLKTWNSTSLTVLIDNASMLKVRVKTLTSDPNLKNLFLRASATTTQ